MYACGYILVGSEGVERSSSCKSKQSGAQSRRIETNKQKMEDIRQETTDNKQQTAVKRSPIQYNRHRGRTK
jgi:hypothetical protein